MKNIKRMIYIVIGIVISIQIISMIVLSHPKFGRTPSGERLARIEKSPNYRNGKFHNINPTQRMVNKTGAIKMMIESITHFTSERTPTKKIPAVKTVLKDITDNSMVWLGHSSYFMKIDNKNILIDPVFNSASPFSFMIKPFDAEYNYSCKDIPKVDILIITHDHWDHLDYEVVKEIKSRVSLVVCPLGVGEHFEYWGYDNNVIVELDWYEKSDIDGMSITCLPTRHYSGRGRETRKNLWGSFMVESSAKTIYIGGDSGYDTHFAKIGNEFTNIDLAILENGQYNEDWRYIHLLPDDLHKAMKDLKAKSYFTGHNSKYALALHSWNEPMKNLEKIAKEDSSLNIITSKIGEVITLQ